MNKKDKATLIIDFFHRTIMHHVMWFEETAHQFGREKAYEVLDEAWKRSYHIQMKRLGKTLGFEMEDMIPQPLLDKSEEEIDALLKAVSINWLANDGVWFQAVEFSRGMNDAKRTNDSTWAHFSPFEAKSIKKILNLPEQAGLEGLKKALQYRLYAYVNKQSFREESANSFVFQMDECRVQLARKRKGLDDYPCKSGGLIEYSSFAEAIDPRIKTEVLSCPPDPHPDDYFCAWRFSIEENLEMDH
jgi:hypothetical protein